MSAQTEQTWEQVWQQVTDLEDVEDEAWEDNYEMLLQLAEHPLDLNRATRDDLEQLPFLSEQQVMDLME